MGEDDALCVDWGPLGRGYLACICGTEAEVLRNERHGELSKRKPYPPNTGIETPET